MNEATIVRRLVGTSLLVVMGVRRSRAWLMIVPNRSSDRLHRMASRVARPNRARHKERDGE
jgi:hypothetical protein